MSAEARQCHTSHHGVEHSEQFLQTEEVPRGLGRVRRGVEVCKLEQWCVDEDREDQQERSDGKCGNELDDEQMRPDVDLVDRRRLDVLDRTRLDHREQPLGVTTGAGWRVWCRSSYGTTCCGSCAGTAASTAFRPEALRAAWPGQGGVVGIFEAAPLCSGVCAPASQMRRSRVAARCSGAFLGLFGSSSGDARGFQSSVTPFALERTTDAAVLADTPEVDRHEDDR